MSQRQKSKMTTMGSKDSLMGPPINFHHISFFIWAIYEKSGWQRKLLVSWGISMFYIVKAIDHKILLVNPLKQFQFCLFLIFTFLTYLTYLTYLGHFSFSLLYHFASKLFSLIRSRLETIGIEYSLLHYLAINNITL